MSMRFDGNLKVVSFGEQESVHVILSRKILSAYSLIVIHGLTPKPDSYAHSIGSYFKCKRPKTIVFTILKASCRPLTSSISSSSGMSLNHCSILSTQALFQYQDHAISLVSNTFFIYPQKQQPPPSNIIPTPSYNLGLVITTPFAPP